MGGCWSGRVLAIRTCEPVRWQFGQACFPGGVGGRAEEAMAGVHEPTLVGALPSARGGRDWLMRREASMVALPFAHHSTMVLCFCGGPGFLNEHSRLQSPSLPSLQVLSSQPIAVSSPSLLSNPTFQPPAPSPHAHWYTHVSGWGMHGCGTDHLCRYYSVLPATDWLLSLF